MRPCSSFLCSLCFSFFILLTAQPNFIHYVCVYDQGSFTGNVTYKANLDYLLSTLTTHHEIDYGFYNFSYGKTHKANVIGLCRGDIDPDSCRRCLNDSIALLPTLCPNQIEAIGWYEECMLRYSDRSLSSFMEPSPAFYWWNQLNASDPDRYLQVAQNLLLQLAGEAASGSSRLKFAADSSSAPNFSPIYGAVQCTPDLSQQDCSDCLLGAIAQIRQCCYGKQGGAFGRPSCNFRFDISKFFQSASPPPPPPPPPLLLSNRSTIDAQGNKGNKSPTGIIVGVSVVVVVIVLIISICIILRTRKLPCPHAGSADHETTDVDSLQFDFDSIRIATNEFSDQNKLGEGGFGAVYKGRLSDGQEIAVKRLSRVSSQGDREFKNEVLLVAKLQHRNLVQMLGFCLKENERLLIYELVQNSSLDKFIFDHVKRESLDWEIRYKIIGGIARGLIYLHEDSQLKIIHRDLKPSNILLDAEMNAKISDFGTAKLFEYDQTQGNASKIIGTFGYMAPEYVITARYSAKSDVFSFGVLLLEIVSGRKNNQGGNDIENVEDLISYAWRNWRNGTALDIVDPCLKIDDGSRAEMETCIHVGLLCVQENLADRPIMSTVLLMIEGWSVTLTAPSRPAFFFRSTTQPNISGKWKGSSLEDSESHNISMTELYPR